MVVSVVVLSGCTDTRHAREGNKLYGNNEYMESAEAYSQGLEKLQFGDETDDTRKMESDILNNRGSALYRQANHKEAQDNWIESANSAIDDAGQSRAYYNAATNAYRMDDKRLALEYLRRALLLAPTNLDAKVNFEFISRQLEDEEQGEGQGKPPEPSEYAKKLKEEADKLVDQRLYREAFDLLKDGLQVDPTVAAYQDFMARDSVVSNIDG